jgi:hypothetical protein
MNVSSVSPVAILPIDRRPRIPYQQDAPASDSHTYDVSNVTDKEAAKLAVDLYNNGKISLHELGVLQLAHPDINEDGSPRIKSAAESRWNLLEYAENSVQACISRNDEQGKNIFQHILDVLKGVEKESGRRVNTSA